jgi:integrase
VKSGDSSLLSEDARRRRANGDDDEETDPTAHGRDHPARAGLVLPALRRAGPAAAGVIALDGERADAERLLRQRLSAKDAGVHGEAAAGRLTVAEGLADMIADYRVNHRRSLKNIEGKINRHLLPYFGERRKMSAITTAMLRGFVVERQKAGGSNAEINRELSILRRAFSLAVAGGRLVQRPHFPMLRENNTRTGFVEAHQYQAVLANLPVEVRPVITFAYITGWRIASEILPLQWRQVDFAAGEVRLDAGTTKNGDGRVFPMTADLRQLLQTLHVEHLERTKAGQLTPQLFVRMVAKGRGGNKRPLPIIAFTKAWKAACRAAGCPGRIPHDLRRTA